MTTIKGKAGEIIAGINKLAMPYSTSVLFNPLRLTFQGGKVRCAVQSANKTAFVMAETVIGTLEGEGDVTFDSQQMLKFLKLYGNDEEVTITFGHTITIKGARKTSTIYPEALTPLVMSRIPMVKDGVVHYRVGEEQVPADTRIELEVSQLESLISDARMVEMATFPLTFSSNGSRASLGSTEAKHNTIETSIHAKVDGPDASITIGDDFPYLFTNLSGIVNLQITDGKPLIVLTNDEKGRYMYIATPLRVE